MLRSLALVPLGAALLGAGCRPGASEPDQIRLPLLRVETPESAVAGASVPVAVRFGIGACFALTAVTVRQTAPARVELEVRARSTAGPGAVCPDVLFIRDTTVALTAPATGELLLRGLQPDGAPLERRVVVAGA
jgi:hypothetical protein